MRFPWDKKVSEGDKPRLLFVGAHPDDIELGCGGLIKKCSELYSIFCCVATDRGSEIRRQETLKALSYLGAENISFLELPPDFILTRDIVNLLYESYPGVQTVFIPTNRDMHPEHCELHRICKSAFRRVPNIYYYQTASATLDFRPNTFFDITDSFEQKRIALCMHVSQMNSQKNYMEYEAIKASAKFWGMQINVERAEAFEIERSILCV